MWYEFAQNGKSVKSLVSVKSNNLKWVHNIEIRQNSSYSSATSGLSGATLYRFLTEITRQILYNFSFTNIHTEDVLFNLTILNEGSDEFMRYNIYEYLDSYVVKINVAGVKKEEMRITLEDGVIKVRANPKAEQLEDADTRLEMFKPTKGEIEIYLPNIESVEAKLEDGILVLTTPKMSKGTRIEIE